MSFLFFFIKEALNSTITSVKDIEREFDIPILGTVPRLLPTHELKQNRNAVRNAEATVSDGKGVESK